MIIPVGCGNPAVEPTPNRTSRRSTGATFRVDCSWKEQACDQAKEWASVLRTGGRPHQPLRSLSAGYLRPTSCPFLCLATTYWGPWLIWVGKKSERVPGLIGGARQRKGHSPTGGVLFEHESRVGFLPDLPSATASASSTLRGWPAANYESAAHSSASRRSGGSSSS